MEYIPGYDKWKTTPPDEQKTDIHCAACGCGLFEGDAVYDFDGEIWCEDCVKNQYRRIL